MFSEELQMLIDAAIADGEITEKERAVLHKRALAEGVDLDELDMILDARLVKRNQAQENSNSISPSAKEEESDEPTAAEQLTAQIEFLEQLYEGKLEDIEDNRIFVKIGGKVEDVKYFKQQFDDDILSCEVDREEAIERAIKNIYVPNKRKEVLDMMILCKKYFDNRDAEYKEELSRAKTVRSDYIHPDLYIEDLDKAFISKGTEAADKARINFSNDSQVMEYVNLIDTYNKSFEDIKQQLYQIKESKKKEEEEEERMKNPINRLKKLFGK